MLLQSYIRCNDLGEHSYIKEAKHRSNRVIIFFLRVWILKFILPSICFAHGLSDLTERISNENETNWSWLHAQSIDFILTQTFVKTTSLSKLSPADITGQSIRICSNYHYAENAQSFFSCLHEVAAFLELSSRRTRNILYNSNNTKPAPAPMNEAYSGNSRYPQSGAKSIKNLFEILELFLCLLIASCVELLPVCWQQFRQWRQQQFHGSSPRLQHFSTRDGYSNNSEAESFCLKLSLWQRLLSKDTTYAKPAINRKQQQISKAKKCLNAFLTVKLPLAPTCQFSKPQQEAFIKDTILHEYALIVWNIIVHEMTRITSNETKSCCLMFYLTPEGVPVSAMPITPCTYENIYKKQPPKDRAGQMHNQKIVNNSSQICKDCNQFIEPNLRLPSSKQQYNCVSSKNVCSVPNCHFAIDTAELKAKQKPSEGAYCSSPAWKSLANECSTVCCCCWNYEHTPGLRECNGGCCCNRCDTCCCSICCCFCNTCCICSWSCCICRSKDCFCCFTCTCSKKTPQPRLQRVYKLIFNNSLSRYFQAICLSVRGKLLNYLQKQCLQRVKLYQRRQRERTMHHTASTTSTLSQKKNFCIGHHGIANCTSNYQQLEASNVCKFFCNNRKRQRRRRRKRKRRRHRHCNLGVQECRCTFAISQAIRNENVIKDISSVFSNYNQQYPSLSLQRLFLSYLKSAVKTITNIYKSNKPQQPQAHFATDKILSPSTASVQWQSTTKHKQQNTHSLRRVHCRGIKSWPNLAWLFIGLVWFESSRLVDCDLQRQMPISEEGVSPKRYIYRSEAPTKNLNGLHECAPKITTNEKIFFDQPDFERQYHYQKRMTTSGRKNAIKQDGFEVLENTSEISVLSDQIRLESIKNQILSKLGLSARPNVSHPLPKQFIWDTISRVDELDTVLKNFDYAAKINTKALGKTGMGVWTFTDGFDHRPQTVQVRVHRNSTHAPHQSYSEQEQQFNLVSQQQHQQQQHQQQKTNRNKIGNKKITYLSGIASEMNVPVTLIGDKNHIRMDDLPSSRFGSNLEDYSDYNGVVSELHRYMQKSTIGKHSNDIELEIDSQEYHGKTEEIISFAEKGELFSHHRLMEFRTRTKEVLINEKLFVRKAEIHLRIESVKPLRPRKKQNDSNKLKIWIFRMTETNSTQKGYEQEIIFCDAFEIDTHHLGWKKLDVTETVRDWFSLKKVGAVENTERLRLLIDCSGCGEHFRLKLFESEQKSNPNYEHKTGRGFKNDVVALWLHQQLEHNNSSAEATFIKTSDEETQQTFSDTDRPFLVIKTELHRARRVRRRVVDCSGALRGQCCKESFYVSFKALGWDDWIIAPRGYFANYCRGDCTGPFRTPDTFQTFHAHFIEEYRKMGLLNGMKPCCAPIKFSSMSLIYYGDDGIIKRDLPKMVVDECGCP